MGLAFTWGSSFILMKRGLEVYTHSEVAALRMVISFLSLLPFAIISLKKLDKKYWKYIIAVGLFGNGIPAFLFTKAQTELSSSLTGMLNSLVPLFTLLLGAFIFRIKIKGTKIIGVVVGLIGAVGLVGSNGLDVESSNMGYSFYVIAATICYAISVNVIKKHLNDIDPMVITSLAFLTIGPPIMIYMTGTDVILTTISNPDSWKALGYISILAVVGTSLSVLVFNMLIKKTSAIFAASVTYLIPIVAIFWGIVDGEVIHILQLICIAIVLFGVYMVNK